MDHLKLVLSPCNAESMTYQLTEDDIEKETNNCCGVLFMFPR
jgi:hypothetical protein